MVLLKSDSIPLGLKAPDFTLQSVTGDWLTFSKLHSKVIAVMFVCNHCPYVKAIEDRILRLSRDLSAEDVQFIAICSNDPTDYPEDSPANLLKNWRDKSYPFPYLIDADQSVAKSYGAVCTPDIFVYNTNRCLAYHGRLDDSWQDPAHVKHEDLRIAITDLLQGRQPSANQTPSMGCSIKWSK